MQADYVVRSRRVFTAEEGVDAARELAFAVVGDRIAVVAEPDELLGMVDGDVPVVDWGDAFVCPGFHDAHLHFFHTAVYESPVALMDMGTSEQELVAHVAEFAKTLADDAWVVCQGWRDYRWDPPVPPTKASLDEAFPDRPVAMCSGDGHTLWVNSVALERMGITRDSVPPEGGSYDHDENGELTGIIREAAAMELQPFIVSTISDDDIARAYENEMARALEQGITSVCDMSLMPHVGCDFIRDDIYDRLQAEGRLRIRAHLFPTLTGGMGRLEAMQERYRDNAYLKAPGFKQFFDGVSSQHTAYLLEPYANARYPGERGRLTIPVDKMRRLVLSAAEHGHAVRIHAIGDGAIHEALAIFEEARERFGEPREGRNSLEHLENLLPSDIDRLRDAHVLASVQPGHITLDPGGPERDLGEERVRCMWPFETYLERRVDFAFGTDSPITPIDSMRVLYAAVTRQDPVTHLPEGGWLPSERIAMADALRAYTLGSARAVGREAELGSIEAGKLADFTVLDHDLLAVSGEEILSTKVLATYVGGVKEFERL